jgi:hypothetical protein
MGQRLERIREVETRKDNRLSASFR